MRSSGIIRFPILVPCLIFSLLTTAFGQTRNGILDARILRLLNQRFGKQSQDFPIRFDVQQQRFILDSLSKNPDQPLLSDQIKKVQDQLTDLANDNRFSKKELFQKLNEFELLLGRPFNDTAFRRLEKRIGELEGSMKFLNEQVSNGFLGLGNRIDRIRGIPAGKQPGYPDSLEKQIEQLLKRDSALFGKTKEELGLLLRSSDQMNGKFQNMQADLQFLQTRLNAIRWQEIAVIFAGLGIAGGLWYILRLFKKNKKPDAEYFACKIIDAKADLILASVVIDEENLVTETRNFELEPLKDVIRLYPDEIFRVGVITKKGIKSFLFESPLDQDLKLFARLDKKISHASVH